VVSREDLASTVASIGHHHPVTKAVRPVLARNKFIVATDDNGLGATTTIAFKSEEISPKESGIVSSTVQTLLESVSWSNVSSTQVNSASKDFANNLTMSNDKPRVASFWYPTLDAIDVIMLAISVMEKILLVGRSIRLLGWDIH
jgi:hypothetical protein